MQWAYIMMVALSLVVVKPILHFGWLYKLNLKLVAEITIDASLHSFRNVKVSFGVEWCLKFIWIETYPKWGLYLLWFDGSLECYEDVPT